MARTETLTAYRCRFSYLKRNNPKREELKDMIQTDQKPNYSFSEFIDEYKEYAKNIAIGVNTDRAISLSDEMVNETQNGTLKIWSIVPKAGKQGKPITIINEKGKKTKYDKNSAAVYDHYVFVYEDKESLIAIFHRQNGSGCKSVFLEIANKLLKDKGLKLEMDLILPLNEQIKNAIPTKITLQCLKENKSSDIAENIGKRKYRKVIRELGLNLEIEENNDITRIIKDFQLNQIDKSEAFALILKETGDSEDYTDAVINMRIGKHTRKVQWNEVEHLMGIHDITESLYAAYKTSNDFVGELSKLSYEYYQEVVALGET